MSNYYHPIDIYCERLSADLFAEPLNLLTNICFIIAGYLLAKQLKRENIQSRSLWWLVVLVVMIGIGSALFHSVANSLTMWMDVIPITVFLLSYIATFIRVVAKQSWLSVAISLSVFLALSYGCAQVPEAWSLNGTISYLPAFLYLGAIYLLTTQHWLLPSLYLGRALKLFIFSAAMRSLDMWLCEWLPIGTHFIWHIVNGFVLYLAVKGLMLAMHPPSSEAK